MVGYETVVGLQIRKIGPALQVNNVITMKENLFTGIGKLKDFQLKTPCRSIGTSDSTSITTYSFQICDQVEEQVNRLLLEDIIEKVEGPT